jgi:hypothetical protein
LTELARKKCWDILKNAIFKKYKEREEKYGGTDIFIRNQQYRPTS